MNVTEGASEGGLGLSAPTDPCLLRRVLPCPSPETKHSGPESADRPPGQREMLSGGCPSAGQALGGSTLRVKQGTFPAKHRPFPRRMALQRSRQVTALLGAQAFCPRPLPSTARPAARSHTRTHAHKYTPHNAHTCTHAPTHPHTYAHIRTTHTHAHAHSHTLTYTNTYTRARAHTSTLTVGIRKLVCPQIPVLESSPPRDGIWRRGLREESKMRRAVRVQPLPRDGTHVLTKATPEGSPPLQTPSCERWSLACEPPDAPADSGTHTCRLTDSQHTHVQAHTLSHVCAHTRTHPGSGPALRWPALSLQVSGWQL